MKNAILVAAALHLLLVPLSGAADEASEELRLNYLALDLMLDGQARIMRIADRMRIAGADLCGKKVSPVIGVYAPNQYDIRDMWREKDFVDPFVEAAQQRYSLENEPRVLAVVPGLAADRAGVRVGDAVTAIDGKLEKRVAMDLLLNRGKSGVVRLSIQRDGASETLELDADMGCSIASRFMFGPTVNAYAMSFGRLTGIYFYAGMLDFFPNDDDLAVVIGHELAHLILGHTSHLRTSKRFEAESDYLGLYLAARAGYDISRAPEVWDALARSNPYSSIDWGFYSHPSSATRSLELLGAIAEIERKRSEGLALAPEKKHRAMDRPDVDEADLEAHHAKLRAEALDRLRSDIQRIQDVSYRLAVAGASACRDQISPVLGATLARRQDFLRAKRAEGEAAFGIGNDVTVLAVAPNSPAERADLRQGDRIHSLDGSRIRKTKQVYERLRKSRGGDLNVRVTRGREKLALVLPRVEGCEHGTLVMVTSEIDTDNHDNRHDMWIPTGLVRFAKDDDELAFAISHQIGHQVVGLSNNSKNEAPADELGLRIAGQAGFDVGKAPAFWDRVAAQAFWKISASTDEAIAHGAMSQRIPAVRAAVAGRVQPTGSPKGALSIHSESREESVEEDQPTE